MDSDAEGFLFPVIIEERCTRCYRCSRICPVLAQSETPPRSFEGFPRVYAAWHLDPVVRYSSSSGGAFSALAQTILDQGGAVVGAAYYDDLTVRHIIVESLEDLVRLRGSKYVQSELAPGLFHAIKNILDKGRLVLFVGTPCQVAGIQAFIGDGHKNLLTCDFICHGVPSPLFFKKYVESWQMAGDSVSYISFRDKCTGWSSFSVTIETVLKGKLHYNMHDDPYMEAFLRDINLRMCCYSCVFQRNLRFGDITLADFWGVADSYPQYDLEDKGTSLVLINNFVGSELLDISKKYLFVGKADITLASKGNKSVVKYIKNIPNERNNFYKDAYSMSFNMLKRKYRLHPRSIITKKYQMFRIFLGKIKKRLVKN